MQSRQILVKLLVLFGLVVLAISPLMTFGPAGAESNGAPVPFSPEGAHPGPHTPTASPSPSPTASWTIEPGDTLVLKGRIVKSSSRLCVAEVEASVDGQVCATATQKYVLAKAEA